MLPLIPSLLPPVTLVSRAVHPSLGEPTAGAGDGATALRLLLPAALTKCASGQHALLTSTLQLLWMRMKTWRSSSQSSCTPHRQHGWRRARGRKRGQGHKGRTSGGVGQLPGQDGWRRGRWLRTQGVTCQGDAGGWRGDDQGTPLLGEVRRQVGTLHGQPGPQNHGGVLRLRGPARLLLDVDKLLARVPRRLPPLRAVLLLSLIVLLLEQVQGTPLLSPTPHPSMFQLAALAGRLLHAWGSAQQACPLTVPLGLGLHLTLTHGGLTGTSHHGAPRP